MTQSSGRSSSGSSVSSSRTSAASADTEEASARLIPFPAQGKTPDPIISFDRKELDLLLNVYGFKVGDGEWRDYAIDMLRDRAVFSVFQRQGDVPLYQIEKNPKLARKQGAYSIINAAGQVLKRGHELKQLLTFFERRPKLKPV